MPNPSCSDNQNSTGRIWTSPGLDQRLLEISCGTGAGLRTLLLQSFTGLFWKPHLLPVLLSPSILVPILPSHAFVWSPFQLPSFEWWNVTGFPWICSVGVHLTVSEGSLTLNPTLPHYCHNNNNTKRLEREANKNLSHQEKKDTEKQSNAAIQKFPRHRQTGSFPHSLEKTQWLTLLCENLNSWIKIKAQVWFIGWELWNLATLAGRLNKQSWH